MFDIHQEIEKITQKKDIKSIIDLLLLACQDKPMDVSILENLFEILSIELTDKISTASIKYSNGQYYLYLNPDFLTKYVSTTNCLLFVILHELYHKIYGDFFLKIYNKYKNKSSKLINIVCDLKINTDLCKTIFKNSYLPIIEKLYWNKDGNILQKLFCSPEIIFKKIAEKTKKFNDYSLDLKKHLEEAFLQEKLVDVLLSKYSSNLAKNKFIRELTLDTYKYIWFTPSTDTSLEEIFNMVYKLLKLLEPNFVKILEDILIIGKDYICEDEDCESCQHKEKSCPYKEKPLPSYISEKFCESIKPGYGNKLYEEKLEKITQKKSIEFYNAVISALTNDLSSQRLKEQFMPEYGFIPEFTRKEVFLLSTDFVPVVYQTSVPKKEIEEMKVHLYIDVSGSTKKMQRIYYGLVLALKDIIGLPVYAFSNQVVELNLEDLKKGIVRTTGGTDINCVIAHADKNNFHRILLVTDGQVSVNETNVQLAKMKPIKIYTVFTLHISYKNIIKSSELFNTGLLSPQDRNRTWWIIGEYLR